MAMGHTTTQYTSAQSIFGRDEILFLRYGVDWEADNKTKNCIFKKYTYQQGDNVLLQSVYVYLLPYVITAVRNNGTIRAHKGRAIDPLYIKNLIPYERKEIVYRLSRIFQF